MPLCAGDDLAHKVESIASTAKRRGGFVVLDIAVERVVLLVRHIRRVRRDQVEPLARLDRSPQIAAAEVDRDAMPARVSPREFHRFRHDVGPDDLDRRRRRRWLARAGTRRRIAPLGISAFLISLPLAHGFTRATRRVILATRRDRPAPGAVRPQDRTHAKRKAHGNTAGARAEVEHAHAARPALAIPRERTLHQCFGARTRNQRAWRDLEVATEEGPEPDQELHGLVSPRPRDQPAQRGELLGREFAIRLHVEPQALDLQHLGEQDLRDRARAVHLPLLQERHHPREKRAHRPALRRRSGRRGAGTRVVWSRLVSHGIVPSSSHAHPRIWAQRPFPSWTAGESSGRILWPNPRSNGNMTHSS